MPNIGLNTTEIAILKNAVRRGEADEDFRKFLTLLDSLLDDRTGRMMLPEHLLERIQVYAFDFRNRTWEALLISVFKRSLGPRLGRSPEHDQT